MNVTAETDGHPSEKDWSWWLKIVGTLAMAPPGIVGCLVTLLVFSRRRALRKTSFSVYLRAQCVADVLTLLQQAFYKLADLTLFLSGGETSLLAWQDKYACQVLEMLKHSLYMIAIWVTVCCCADRYASLCFPLSSRTRIMRRPRTALIVTAVLCLAAPLIASYYVVMTTRSANASAEAEVCVTVPDLTLRTVHGIVDNVVHLFILKAGLPFMAIAILNLLTVRALRRRAQDIPKGLNTSQPSNNMTIKLNKVMLFISVFFVICSLPHIIAAFASLAYITRSRPPILWRLMYVADFMDKLGFLCNFVIYSLMRKQFNEELRKVFSCCNLRVFPSSKSRGKYDTGSAFSSMHRTLTLIISVDSVKAVTAAS